MRRPRIIFAYMMLLIGLPIFAAADDGGTESVFNLGAGARAMGMGNGYIALTEDATAVYYNPSGVPYLWSQQISFLHTVLFEGTVYDYVAYVYPYSSIGGFGIAGMRMGTDDIGRRDAFTDLGRFSSTQMQLMLSYGRRFGDDYSGGVTLKLAHHAIDDYSDYGFGFDLAGRYLITEQLRAGIVLQDIIGARMKLIDDNERTPFTFKAGLAYLYRITDRPFSGALTFDVEKPEKRNVKIHTGLEIVHTSGLALRGGYDRDNVSLGLGIMYQQLSFDYAYKFVEHLMDSHRFSLSFDFGITRDEIERRRAAERRGDIKGYLKENRQESFRRALKHADDLFEEREFDSALAAYFRAEAFADGDEQDMVRNRIIETKDSLAMRRPPVEIERVEVPVTDDAGLIVRQASRLVENGALLAARQVVENARKAEIDSDELQALQEYINARVDERIRTALREADQAFNKGDFVEAYKNYGDVLEFDRSNRTALEGARAAKLQIDLAQHLKQAIDYFEQERYILSQRKFNSVLQLDPNNEAAFEYLERIDEIMKDESLPVDQNLQQDTTMQRIYTEGLDAYQAGDYQRAIDLWEQVLKKYPNHQGALKNIRQARLRLRE